MSVQCVTLKSVTVRPGEQTEPTQAVHLIPNVSPFQSKSADALVLPLPFAAAMNVVQGETYASEQIQ